MILDIFVVIIVLLLLMFFIMWDVEKEDNERLRTELKIERSKTAKYMAELDLLGQLETLRLEIMKKYGVDVSRDWSTATSQVAALNEAYLRGRADERKRCEDLLEDNHSRKEN